MFRNIILGFACLFSCALVKAQDYDEAGKFLYSASSPNGNYVYLFSDTEILGKDSATAASTAYFIIERFQLFIDSARKNAPAKNIVEYSGVTNVRDLRKYYTATQIEELKKLFELNSDAALVSYFQTNKQASAYNVLYSFVETKQAVGHVYLDEDVDAGAVYTYQVTRVDKANNKEKWGFAITEAKAGNYMLPYYKPVVSNTFYTDSSVSVTWKMPVNLELINSVKPPRSKIDGDEGGMLYRMPFNALSTRAKVFVNDASAFTEKETLLPRVNETNDTITYVYYQRTVPDQEIVAYLQTEDIVYNSGIYSDTAFAYTINRATQPVLAAIRVQDVVNGIQISWEKPAKKPYITGIEIGKYNSRDEYDSIATVPITDSTFTDYNVEIGQTYRYKAKLIFLPGLDIEQVLPAEGAGTFSLFSNPMPVVNLKIINQGIRPVLTWDKIVDPSFFGSFIYRGTSAKELDLIAGPIKTNKYVDSADNLTGRNEYFYAVINQNLRQDTSVFSEIVSILPNIKIEIYPPTTMDFYYANDSLRISWNEIRANDNSIEKFVVLKSTATGKTFSPIANSVATNSYSYDTGLQSGVNYNYKVAAISFRGDTSAYGQAYTFTLPNAIAPQTNLYYVRNINEGIQISLPTIAYAGRKGYNIYRREATQKEFVKLGSIAEGIFSFIDKNVKENVIYVYGITVVQQTGEEGKRGKSVSLRRSKK